MTLTTQILTTLEQECDRAPPSMLERCIRFIEAGLPHAAPEVKAHARVLILKLEHLVRCQRVASVDAPDRPLTIARAAA